MSSKANGFFVSGGTLPLESGSYVERSADKVLFEALIQGQFCYVLNSRQMGKSSLSVQAIAKLESRGVNSAFVDLTRIGGQNVTAEQWYLGLSGEVGRDLDLRSEMLAYCRSNSELSPMQRFFGALREIVLGDADSSKRFVIFIDEIDSTRTLKFDTDEFFAGIRECFNRRVLDPVYNRITFCLLGVAVPSDLIRNSSTTPFNIGERINLEDFTLEEMHQFAKELGPNGNRLVERVHYWTNGHPFLSQSLCLAIAAKGNVNSSQEVDDLVSKQLFEPKARVTNINLSDVSNRALHSGDNEVDPNHFRADLLSAYNRILSGKRVADDESNRVAVLLKLSGLVRTIENRLEVRNRIYRHVFEKEWVQENMPGQELARQQQSFRLGVIRAALVSTGIIGVVGGLGGYAWQSRIAAVKATNALDYELYVADMNNLRIFEETGDTERIETVLRRTKDSPHRGFEWGYWQGRVHGAKEEYTMDYAAPGKRESGILSTDGTQLCILDTLTRTATIVDRSTKKVLATSQLGRTAEIVALRDRWAVIETLSKPLKITDFITQKTICSIDEPNWDSISVVFRQHTNFLLMRRNQSAVEGSDKLILWDISNGKKKFEYSSPESSVGWTINYSIDGKRIILGERKKSDQSIAAKVIETNTGKIIDQFPLLNGTILCDYSDEGDYLLYRSDDYQVTCRDILGHRDVFVRSYKFSDTPTGIFFIDKSRYIASLSSGGKVNYETFPGGVHVAERRNVWNVSTGSQRDEILESSTSVRILKINDILVSRTICPGARANRTGQGDLYVSDFRANKIKRMTDPDLTITHTFEVPDGVRTTYNGLWFVYSTQNDHFFFEDVAKALPPTPLPFPSPYFACGTDPNYAVLVPRKLASIQGFSAVTGRVTWTSDEPSKITGIWVDPSSRFVLAGEEASMLRILDAKTGKFLSTLEGHNVRMSNITFSSDHNKFFTCGADGRTILWDLNTRKKLIELRGNAAQVVTGADISPDGKRIATCNIGGGWQLWDAVTGYELLDMQASSLPLRSIFFTSDGKRLITGGDDEQIRAWETFDTDTTFRVVVDPKLLAGIQH